MLSSIKPRVAVVKCARTAPLSAKTSEGGRDRKRFYDSALWQRTREAKLRRDPCCQACAFMLLVVQAKHVDHWSPLAQGGHPTADDNLVSLCHSCHSRKTLAEQRGDDPPQIVPSALRQFGIA